MSKVAPSESGFGSVVLVLLVLILTVSIGYTVSQINKPTFEKSLAFEGSENMSDSVNWGSMFEIALDGIENVIDTQTSQADQVINNPNSTPDQINAAKAVKEQRAKDQAELDKTFGQVPVGSNGKPDYSERNQKIKDEWSKALVNSGGAPLPVDFVPNVTNPPIVPKGTSDIERYNANSQKARDAASIALGGGK
jgi:hypothetical protein